MSNKYFLSVTIVCAHTRLESMVSSGAAWLLNCHMPSCRRTQLRTQLRTARAVYARPRHCHTQHEHVTRAHRGPLGGVGRVIRKLFMESIPLSDPLPRQIHRRPTSQPCGRCSYALLKEKTFCSLTPENVMKSKQSRRTPPAPLDLRPSSTLNLGNLAKTTER